MLADGSPTHFLRILSYGLANPMTKMGTNASSVSVVPQKGAMRAFLTVSAADLGR